MSNMRDQRKKLITADADANGFQQVLIEYYGLEHRIYCPLCITEILSTVLDDLFHWASYQPKLNLTRLYKDDCRNSYTRGLSHQEDVQRILTELPKRTTT